MQAGRLVYTKQIYYPSTPKNECLWRSTKIKEKLPHGNRQLSDSDKQKKKINEEKALYFWKISFLFRQIFGIFSYPHPFPTILVNFLQYFFEKNKTFFGLLSRGKNQV